MKNTDLNHQFEDITKKTIALRKSISKLTSSDLKTEIVGDLAKTEKSIVSAKAILSTCFAAIASSILLGLLIAMYAFSIPIMMDEPTDSYSDFTISRGLMIGDLAGTTPEYTFRFNESFLGFVTDVNRTNRTETAMVTIKNGEQEIILNEYWLQWAGEEWFEDNYGVDFNDYPAHYTDFNGTYQLVDDWYSPYSDDWDIIHTQDGVIRLEYYSPEDRVTLYYYNKTLPGGAEVSYSNEKFIIVYSQEEIEYERIV